MKGVGKIEVILSWDDSNCFAQFRRGNDQEEWGGMSRDEQTMAVDAMLTMAELFNKHIKESD